MMSEPLELERRLDREEWIIEREANIRLVAAGFNELPEALPPLSSQDFPGSILQSHRLGPRRRGNRVRPATGMGRDCGDPHHRGLECHPGVCPGISSRAVAVSPETTLRRGARSWLFKIEWSMKDPIRLEAKMAGEAYRTAGIHTARS